MRALSTLTHSTTPVLVIFALELLGFCQFVPSGPFTERRLGLLQAMIRPSSGSGAAFSCPIFQRHTLPSSNGPTAMLFPAFFNSPRPRVSSFSPTAFESLIGCCSQLSDKGACLAVYSLYQSTLSCGYVGSQQAIGRAVALASLRVSTGIEVSTSRLLPTDWATTLCSSNTVGSCMGIGAP